MTGGGWIVPAERIALSRLQRSKATLDAANVDIDAELRMISRRLSQSFPVLAASGGVDALTGDDSAFWGEGIGLMAAARLRPVVGASVPTGEIVGSKQDTVETKYAPTTGPRLDIQTPEERWTDEAWDALQLVTVIAVERAAFLASITLFSLNGPRRAAEAAGYPSRSHNPLYSVLTDMAIEEGIAPPFLYGPWGV